MGISTRESDINLKRARNFNEFLAMNKKNMLTLTLSEYLNQLLEYKSLKLTSVIRKSGLVKTYVYQIFNGEKNPSRDKLIALAFGLELNEEETQRMLKLGGCSELFPRIERDALILFNIQHGKSIDETEAELYDHGFDTLLSRNG